MAKFQLDPKPFQRVLRTVKDPRVQVGMLLLTLLADLFQVVDFTRAWYKGNGPLITRLITIFGALLALLLTYYIATLLLRHPLQRSHTQVQRNSGRRPAIAISAIICTAVVAGLVLLSNYLRSHAHEVVVGVVTPNTPDAALEQLTSSALAHIPLQTRSLRALRIQPSQGDLSDGPSLIRLANRSHVDLLASLSIDHFADRRCFIATIVYNTHNAGLVSDVTVEGNTSLGLFSLSPLNHIELCANALHADNLALHHRADSLLALAVHCLAIPVLVGKHRNTDALILARADNPLQTDDRVTWETHQAMLSLALMASDSLRTFSSLAEEWYRKAPHSIIASVNLLLASQVTDDLPREYIALNSLVANDASNPRWRLQRACLALRHGDLDTASVDGNRLLNELRLPAKGMMILAQVATLRDQDALALSLFKDTIQDFPGDWHTYDLLGRYYWHHRHFWEAADAWTRALSVHGVDRNAVSIRRAQAWCALGELPRATQDLRNVDRDYRLRGVASYHLARMQVIAGRLSEAEHTLTVGMAKPLPEAWLYLKRWRVRLRLNEHEAAGEDSAYVFSSFEAQSTSGRFVVRFKERMEADSLTIETDVKNRHITSTRSILTPDEDVINLD